MKFRKILSAVTALAMSASAVAGLAVTANAATTTETLSPTAGWSAGASGSGITATSFTSAADVKTLYFFNNTKGSSWVCQGVALLQFTLPQIEEGEQVFSATLTSQARVVPSDGISVSGYGSGRTYDIYQMPTEPEASTYSLTSIDDDTSVVSALSLSNQVASGCFAQASASEYYAQPTDVTEEVAELISSEGTTTITFAYTNILKFGYLDAATSTLAITYGTGYDYTVNYYLDEKADGNLVATGSGSTIATSMTFSDDTAVIGTVGDYEGTTYYVKGDQNFEVTQTEGVTNSFDVIVTEPRSFTATLTATLDGVAMTDPISSDTGTEGSTVTLYYPEYIIDNGTVYKASPQSTNPWYGYSGLSYASPTRTVTYTNTGYSGTPVLFIEAEKVSGMNARNDKNYNIRFSGGYGAYCTSAATITSLDAGTYRLISQTRSADSNAHSVTFAAGNMTIGTYNVPANDNGAIDVTFAIDKTSNLTVVTGEGTSCVDYFLIIKLDPEIVATAATATLSATDISNLKEVDVSGTGAEPAVGNSVTTYTIKVAVSKYAAGVPTLVFDDYIEGTTNTLTPSGSEGYGYQGSDDDSAYYIFVIQTLNINDVASKVTFGSTEQSVTDNTGA